MSGRKAASLRLCGFLAFTRRRLDVTVADQVLVVHNPTAGAGGRARQVNELAAQLSGRRLRPVLVDHLEQLGPLAEAGLHAGELRAVVAAGGDGTAETVANLTPPGTPLVVFPLGTENLLAKYLGITASPEQVVDLIVANQRRQLDVGLVESGEGDRRLFLLMMGCGFDGDVIHRLHKARRGHITHLSYAKPILETIRKYDYPKLRMVCFEVAGRSTSPKFIDAHWAFIFNTPSYAAGLAICPDADPSDGYLDIVTFRGGSFWKGLLHLTNVLLRRQHLSRRVQMVRAKRIRLEADASVPFQIDGDPGGVLPVEITIQPQRLTVLVPPGLKADTMREKGVLQ